MKLWTRRIFLLGSIAVIHAAVAGQPLEGQRARVIVDVSRPLAEISPLLYGQFAELMYGGVKGGLHAELLRDRGFEEPPNAIGLPRYWERYPDDRNDDYGLAFKWDDSVAYPVETEQVEPRTLQHSLRIDARRGVISRHGIFQPRISIRSNTSYHAYFWAKTSGYAGRIQVALEQDADEGTVYASAESGLVQGDWRKYEFALSPKRADPLARLVILFSGQGRIWIDQASLIPDDALSSVRRDVYQRVLALKPAFIRWPGGNVAQDYHWRWGVGPRDRRPTWVNISWGNEPEPGDFGTDEFVAFARGVGAQPSLTVNVEGRGATPAEAAAWVEYCNGAATSRYGSMRAANGHAQPYGVKYWEIGNEIWGNWVRGHSDAQTYARNYRRYQAAMRAVDPSIKFIAVGDNDMSWNRTVLANVGPDIDYLAIHHYYGGDSLMREPKNLFARPLYFERFYQQVDSLAKSLVPGHRIALAINEWGLDLPESNQYSMDAAVYGARLMNVFERSAPIVGMSAVSDMVNGWPGGIIQASRSGVFVSPLYWTNLLYGTMRGSRLLVTNVESPTFESSREGTRIPLLDVSATESADGRSVYVKLVNTGLSAPLFTQIDITGGKVTNAGEIVTLAAAPGERNSFANPNSIAPRFVQVSASSHVQLVLPARSASVVTLHVVHERELSQP
ncbi:MAG: alpha-L-arabinofuranosidase C-terminal domain-containing protein [Gemmatimonadaceae bacterium]